MSPHKYGKFLCFSVPVKNKNLKKHLKWFFQAGCDGTRK